MNQCCQGEKELEKRFPEGEVDLKSIDPIIKKYKGEQGSLITLLQKMQDTYGYLPREALKYAAKQMGIKPAKVFGVATFYTQFRLQPIGKYLIMLCEGTACHVNGAERIKDALCEELNIQEGETTEDGMFTLESVACLGCCSLAPVMMINGETYGKLTPSKAREVVREIREKSE